MKVTVVFDYSLRRYHPSQDKSLSVNIPQGSSVADLLKLLTIIPGEIGVIVRNSQLAQQEDVLEEGDILELYEVMGGG